MRAPRGSDGRGVRRVAIAAGLVVLAWGLPSCRAGGPEPESGRVLGSGHWSVVARTEGRALLARLPERGVGAERAPRAVSPPAPEVLVYPPAGTEGAVAAEAIPLTLPGVPAPLARDAAVGRARLEEREVYFGLPGAGPALLASPADPGLVLFEEANALWTLTPRGAARRLTAVRVGGFDYRELAARQREGEVILYWAAAPVWSPDGRFVAYATNREAVAEGGGGQAVWLLEVSSGRERALLREPGRSFRPVGWLGAELVYVGDEPGVWAVDPATGARRRLAPGVELDAAEDGSAVAVAEGVPDATVVRVLSRDGAVTVPPPPPGFTFGAQALFSPDGRRLLLGASAESGTVRRFLVFDRRSGRLSTLGVDGRSLADWPAWLDDETLLLNVASPAGERHASTLRVP